MTFRNLFPSEIQIRPTDTKYKGSATLLLYQDARCAMDILDETIGSEKWQKEYYEVKGNVYCRIGILTENGWVWKGDCGIESNVDAQKGEASDAFKRAAVNWGIGRELYSGPRIKIKCPDSYYYEDHLTMQFYVKDIAYDGKTITAITVCDRFNNVVFDWDVKSGTKVQNKPVEATERREQPTTPHTSENSVLDGLKAFCGSLKGKADKDQLLKFYNFWEKKTSTWRGSMDYQRLWEKWQTTARNGQ